MATAAERKRKSRVAGSNRERDPSAHRAKPGQIRISPPVLIRERLNVDPVEL
jgi:hypothetical protein